MDEHRVHVDPNKIQFIHDWESMVTLKNLHNFLGLTNFYLRVMLVLSHIAWPLIQVTRGVDKAKFASSKSQQKAFQDMKH
jgi:hypothetical protein